MKYLLMFLLFALIKSHSVLYTRCLAASTQSEKRYILSNIRNNMPESNSYKILEIHRNFCLCINSCNGNQLVEGDLYRSIWRAIFENEGELTSIHKDYCNHGLVEGVKTCFSLLGKKYKCNQLIKQFGPCSNDYNYRD